jgi:hypothetical protein
MARVSSGEKSPPGGEPGGAAPAAHRRPGYPLVGLLASRARLRLARPGKGSAGGQGSKEARNGESQERVSGRQEGAMVASGKGRQDARDVPDGPGLLVLPVTVGVP